MIMGIFEFIAEQRIDEIFDTIPFPRAPRWRIEGPKALCEWDKALAWRRVELPDGTWETHGLLPPPIEDIIGYLFKQGWKRGGWFEDNHWALYTYIRHDDVEIRIRGAAGYEHPDKDTMNHFYAPAPPTHYRKRSFKADYEEYTRKCREDEW